MAGLGRVWRRVLGVLAPFPAACCLCGRPGPLLHGHRLCRGCRDAAAASVPACRGCGRPRQAAGPGPPPAVCAACRVAPPPYRGLVHVGPYRGLLRWAIRRFKQGESFLARPLGRMLAGAAADLPPPDVLVPVPPSSRGWRRRGYAHTRLLAEELVAAGMTAPVAAGALRRRAGSPAQTGLPRAVRVQNAARAFLPGRTAVLRGRRVWLLDDVVTTGATVAACTRLLLAAGAREVWCLAVAVTPPGRPGRPRRGLPPRLNGPGGAADRRGGR